MNGFCPCEPGKEDFGESSYRRMLPNMQCGDRETVELVLLEKKQHLVVENELFPSAPPLCCVLKHSSAC